MHQNAAEIQIEMSTNGIPESHARSSLKTVAYKKKIGLAVRVYSNPLISKD